MKNTLTAESDIRRFIANAGERSFEREKGKFPFKETELPKNDLLMCLYVLSLAPL